MANHKKSCEGCLYWRPLAHITEGRKVCHYILDQGHMRGCPPDANCNQRITCNGEDCA